MIGARVEPGAPFRFASDIDDYVGWTLARVLHSPDFDWSPHGPDDWRLPYPNWVPHSLRGQGLRGDARAELPHICEGVLRLLPDLHESKARAAPWRH